MSESLHDLERFDAFEKRHIGPRPHEIEAMLATIGCDSLGALIDQTIPARIRSPLPELAPPMTEQQVLEALQAFAGRNRVATSLIGQGYHDCVTPAVIQRNVLENPGWYTAYTPYQAEIAQGRLELLLVFQQMVMDLTGMDLANASLLDEGTAAAEAMAMMHRLARNKSDRCFVAASCHPQTIAVLQTRARPLGIDLVVGDPATDFRPEDCFGLILQYPETDGTVRAPGDLVERAHAAGALVTVAADLLSLAVLTPPGEWGADVVVGSAQRFGVPLGFGGPHAAFFATRDAHKRSVPGRIVGVSVDGQGRPAYRLALQTREQHIRREKATSNICTAQVLLAVMAALYAVWHGPEGLSAIARRVHRLTAILARGLTHLGFPPENAAFFDTLTVKADDEVWQRAEAAGLNLRHDRPGLVSVALDETCSRETVKRLLDVFGSGLDHGLTIEGLEAEVEETVPPALRRRSDFLTHPTFHAYRSETEMLRWLRRLREKDVALDRAMIPLGSCTMKLNAAVEMAAVTWPQFARLHPFAPESQTAGIRALIADLERKLAALTGFAAVSLQPNAGSQGEYAGLLAIRGWHVSRGETHRNVCLIPSSAHGTNPASAIMAGMEVVVVQCDTQGNVDVADLERKAAAHADRLAALMVTYPSTHGVFEEAIGRICEIVHGHGGQVYMDGANFNAMVGLCRPGDFGPDVMHLNLHKTFCIPHGGGGPGVGPIAVAAHLADFLPNHPDAPSAGPATGPGPVSAAPWGSALILVIPWAYIALMGAEGLKRASEVAILSANYLAARLKDHYPVLYKGRNERVAHECILDCRAFKDSAGITVDDIAKRLMDYGFHAPTMSWPVAGTLMVEPTESEPKAELDRFVDAMAAIRREIAGVADGSLDRRDNPLVNAPHTLEAVTAEEWRHAYPRAQAAFPVSGLRADKYWPPVGRIDNAVGDRQLVCSCPPLEDYAQAAE